MKLNILVQFFDARKMRIFLEFFWPFWAYLEPILVPKIGFWAYLKKSGNWELVLGKKWMKRNIMLQFLAARKMRIFSEFFLAILNLFGTYFGTKNRFLSLFLRKIRIVNWFQIKSGWNSTYWYSFSLRERWEYFRNFFGHFEPIWDLFWYKK